MSVINQMLRDLDARQASEQERTALPSRLRPLPPARQAVSSSLHMLFVGVGIGALGVGLALMLVMAPFSTPKEGAPAAAASAPAAAPPAISPAPTFADPKEIVKLGELSEMKFSLFLTLANEQNLQESATRPTKPEDKKTEKEPGKPVPTSQNESAPAAAASAARTADAPDARIDKRSQGGPGRELAEAEYRKGMQAVKRGESAAAQPLFRHALELDPLHARARQALLSVLVGAKAWDEAKQVAEAGLALDPAQSGWAMILARLQFEQSDAQAALATLEKHAAHAAQDADYQSLFAYLLQKEKRFAEAAERFRAALALRPAEGRWWFGLGIALENGGRNDEARQAYAKAKESGNLPADLAAAVEQKLKAAP